MKQPNGRGVLYAAVTVAALFVAVVSGTFAYFQVSASNSNVIVGNVATTSLVLNITKPSNLATAQLIPLNNSLRQKAINGTESTMCRDSNGYSVCQLYTITIYNTSTSQQRLTGTLNLVAASAPNLKWTLLTDIDTLNESATVVTKNTVGTLTSSLVLNAGANQSYYVMVWIAEAGGTTAQTDSGSFVGTVNFSAYGGQNLTATFS